MLPWQLIADYDWNFATHPANNNTDDLEKLK